MGTLFSRFKTFMEANISSSKVVDGHIQQWGPTFPLLIFYEGQPSFPTDYDEGASQVRIWPFRVVLVSNTEANLETLMENYLTQLNTYNSDNRRWANVSVGVPWAKQAGYKAVEYNGQEEETIGVTSW